MAGSVNKATILGNLGADPEIKYLPSGQAVCELRIATTETYKDKNDQRQDRTEWHRIVVWGKTAENCAKFLKKGQQVYVDGRIQTRSWENKEGVKQYTTEIVADQVVFLRGTGGPHSDDSSYNSGASYGGSRSNDSGRGRSSAPVSDTSMDAFPSDDDIPF